MQPLCDTNENRAAFRARLVADCDDIGKHLAGLDEIEHGFGLVARNVNADFLHGFHNNRIEFARLKTGTVGFKLVAADLIQERLGHLAAGAVMDANEQNFTFHNYFRFWLAAFVLFEVRQSRQY